jgi:hypothetical protein
MLKTLKALFDPKKNNYFIKDVDIKDWGNRVIVTFVLSQNSPQNGTTLKLEFEHCYGINWQFLGHEEYVSNEYADVIGVDIRPQADSTIQLVLPCDLFELSISFRDLEILSA